MKIQLTNITWPQAILALLLVLTLGGVAVAASTSTAAFGPYNPTWDGASDFQSGLADNPDVESTVIRETSAYGDLEAASSVAFVVAPTDTYDEDASANVATFVEDGGTVVILENFEESGNALLADIGADARFDGQLIRDEERYTVGPTMPLATEIEANTTATVTDGVEELALNYATPVRIDDTDADVLVATSSFAYLADGPDDELDEDEHELESLPIVTVETVGNGAVYAIGDPSIATNVMYGEGDNARLLANIATNHDTAVIDVSHAEPLPPTALATLVIRDSALLQGTLGFVAIGIVALLSRQRGPSREALFDAVPAQFRQRSDAKAAETTVALSDDERAVILRQRYPDWDDDRIERVIAAFNRPDSELEDEYDRD